MATLYAVISLDVFSILSIGKFMPLIIGQDSEVLFDEDKNAQFALQVFETYFRTPDATGKTYAAFPDFFLIKPHVLDAMKFPMHRHEEQLLLAAKFKALERGGYIGVTKYFDEEFGYHWIKFSPFPFHLGDEVSENQAEYYFLLRRFIDFTKHDNRVYGDLSSPDESHQEMRALLRDVTERAGHLQEKLKQYPEAKLLSYDSMWPRSEVRKLLDTLKKNDEGGHRVLTEYLRQAMRVQAGIARKAQGHQDSLSGAEQGSNTLPRQKQVSAGVLELATVRSTHLARVGEETRYKALKAEEEKIRLEALAIVAARKQILASEEASREALERIEQIRLARNAEELRLSAIEKERLESERLADEALAQRLALAAQASATAKQRHLLEASLLQQMRLDSVAQQELASNSTHLLMADPEKTQGISGKASEVTDLVSTEHNGVGQLELTGEPALITLDFKSPHKLNATPVTHTDEVTRYDPFAYEERLLEQHQGDDVTQLESLNAANTHFSSGKGWLSRQNIWRSPSVTQFIVASLFLTLGLIVGRYLLTPQQGALPSAKVQPISYSMATAKPNPAISSIPAIEVVIDRVDGGAVAAPIPLKMTDHLSR